MTEPVTRHQLETAGCTPAETEAALLYELGWAFRAIAAHLDISTTTVRDRIDRAARRLHHHEQERPQP